MDAQGQYRIVVNGILYDVSVVCIDLPAETYIPPIASRIISTSPATWVTAKRVYHLPAR